MRSGRRDRARATNGNASAREERVNVLDLFSGAAGGWSVGLHRAGFRTVAACELDDWRRETFGRNFPDARLYADVLALSAARLAADGVPAVDVVAGSPPCQDASVARRGERSGIAGARTGLFGEYLRLVRELRPRWALAENVLGLVGTGADDVASELVAAGYRVWIYDMGAEDFGATHERRRIWYVGLADADKARLENSWRLAGAARPDRRGAALRSVQAAGHPWRQGEGDAVRMADGFPRDVASGRVVAAYGDAVVPQITEAIGRAIMTANSVTIPMTGPEQRSDRCLST